MERRSIQKRRKVPSDDVYILRRESKQQILVCARLFHIQPAIQTGHLIFRDPTAFGLHRIELGACYGLFAAIGASAAYGLPPWFAQLQAALCRPSPHSPHAAARPVETAVRCERKIKGCLHSRFADNAAIERMAALKSVCLRPSADYFAERAAEFQKLICLCFVWL